MHFHILILPSNTKECKNNVIELQYSQFTVLQGKEASFDWFFRFDFRFAELYFLKKIIALPQSLERVIVDGCMCLFIICLLYIRMATAIYKLITIRAVCKQLDSLKDITLDLGFSSL